MLIKIKYHPLLHNVVNKVSRLKMLTLSVLSWNSYLFNAHAQVCNKSKVYLLC